MQTDIKKGRTTDRNRCRTQEGHTERTKDRQEEIKNE